MTPTTSNPDVIAIDRSGILPTRVRRPTFVGLALVFGTLSCGDDGTISSRIPEPTKVTVTPAFAELSALEATVQLSAQVLDQDGNTMATVSVSWSTSNASVAAVDPEGLVTAADNGSATVSATAGAASGSAAVTVAQMVSIVTLTPSVDSVVEADTVRLMAEAFDANGHAVTASEFTWTSGDTLVAIVDTVGLVTGLAVGEVEITATSSGAKGSADLTVVEPVPTSVVVAPDTVNFTAFGQTRALSAEVRDQIGRAMERIAVSWSTGDTMVVLVDSAGLLTSAGNGSATVTATASTASGNATVSVAQVAGSISVTPSAASILMGDTLRLVAEAFDENGHAVEETKFVWSSEDVSLAAVGDAGLVSGVTEGTTTITAASGSASGTSEITVQNPDRLALAALYAATDGPNWRNNSNWLTDRPLTEWYGVSTDGDGRVVELNLRGRWEGWRLVRHGLQGHIPPELGYLAKLKRLDLALNNLTGPVPPEMGGLANLEAVDLARNNLTGPIPPELGGLANLELLHLATNNLTGPVPPEMGGLANLEALDLARNNLTGPIPPELGGLANLRALDLARNDLSGVVPLELSGLANLRRLDLGANELTGPVPSQLGNLANLEYLYLPSNRLTGLIPLELGDLANLRALDLGSNNLTGHVPPELARLADLGSLDLRQNNLTGPVPYEWLTLTRLTWLGITGDYGLCVPGVGAFVEWYDKIDQFYGSFCNEVDMAVLRSFHSFTRGTQWRNADGWLGSPALEEWYGVTADSLGRVTALSLEANGLVGGLPLGMGRLSELSEFRIGDNEALTGRMPVSLARLSLAVLHYAGTDLCVPPDDTFQGWLDGILSHEGTGMDCPRLSDRDILAAFYHSTSGPNWSNNANWLTDAPLSDWHGVELDSHGKVVAIGLARNRLTGQIPMELGDLTSLKGLLLPWNDLTGSVPPELGNLANLEYLHLGSNGLTGPIPRELGKLPNLRSLFLTKNAFTGHIPPELGDLANLEGLWLTGNRLAGHIPPELGDLSNLKGLGLSLNKLTGPIPPELGDLTNLVALELAQSELEDLRIVGTKLTGHIPPELGKLDKLQWLYLNGTFLSGGVPSEFGNMSSLTLLDLGNNPGMEGALPSELTALERLDRLSAAGSGLCAPADPAFEAWLATIRFRWIDRCGEAMAYLVQAVQSHAQPVPLVAGRKALLRVFPTTRRATRAGLPPVRAHFYLDGRETHVVDIPGKSTPIPTEVDEGDLAKSSNAEIPGEMIEPGLQMVIEIDPEGTLNDSLGVPKRVPATGRLAVDVEEMPIFDLTLVPFVWTGNHDSSIVDLVRAVASDAENHEMLGETRRLLPVGRLEVKAHDAVLSSSNNAYQLLYQTRAIRSMEGGTGHYMGMMPGSWVGPVAGVAQRPGRSSFSIPSAGVIAHELGHNMSLYHAPCNVFYPVGDPNAPDPWYPHTDGSIGAWGYSFQEGNVAVHPSRPDLMSYCDPAWVSDYHFVKALRYRLSDEGAQSADVASAPTRSLLLWGGVTSNSQPFLEPTFVVDAPASLPDAAGAYEVTGESSDGRVLFSLSFDMPEVLSEKEAGSSFAFVLPGRSEWSDALSAITLTGPGGSVTLDKSTARAMVILRSPRTGQVRGILRDMSEMGAEQAPAYAEFALELGLEVLYSRGIPDPAAWRR